MVQLNLSHICKFQKITLLSTIGRDTRSTLVENQISLGRFNIMQYIITKCSGK